MNITAAWYAVVFVCVLLLDRVTKLWALAHAHDYVLLNHVVSCDLTYNRGFSWGMMHSGNNYIFYGVTAVIIAVFATVLYVAYQRWQQQYIIIGEVLVLAGALSNVIDRVVYKGVIDFIIVSISNYYTWPVFNIADVFIVLGAVCMMFFLHYKYDETIYHAGS